MSSCKWVCLHSGELPSSCGHIPTLSVYDVYVFCCVSCLCVSVCLSVSVCVSVCLSVSVCVCVSTIHSVFAGNGYTQTKLERQHSCEHCGILLCGCCCVTWTSRVNILWFPQAMHWHASTSACMLQITIVVTAHVHAAVCLVALAMWFMLLASIACVVM